MERLRHVARATGIAQSTLVREAADALALAGDNPAGLVTASRRVMAQQPSAAGLVYLCARMLCADRPGAEAWAVLDDVASDRTETELTHAIPDDARVCVLGSPDVIGAALRRRGDVTALVVDVFDEGSSLAMRLRGNVFDERDYSDYRDHADYSGEFDGLDVAPVESVAAVDVPVTGLGAAVAASQLLLLDALAIGPTQFLAPSGSLAAAAVARAADVPVWLVGGVGRVLPGRMWDGLLGRLGSEAGFAAREEVVSLDFVTSVVGPTGLLAPDRAVAQTDCPIVPELF